MTDETKDTAAAPEQPVDATVMVAADDAGVEAVAAGAVQGNRALIVAQFADMDAAKKTYYTLIDAEAKRAIDIDGVMVVNADYQGKINVQKMTDHKTRNGSCGAPSVAWSSGSYSRPRSLPAPWPSAPPVRPWARSATPWPRARSRTSWPG